jgi:MFS family permease
MIATPRGAATTWSQWIALSLYGLALTMTSNIVDPPWLSQKASQLAGPGWQNTLLGSVAFIGLVWAALVQPIFGAWSDQLRSPWGRRKPFLWLGSLLLALALALLVAAPSVPMLILALLLVQTFSNMVQAAYQGLIPDHVPEDRRGRASGIKGFMEIPAVVIGPPGRRIFPGARPDLGAVSGAAGGLSGGGPDHGRRSALPGPGGAAPPVAPPGSIRWTGAGRPLSPSGWPIAWSSGGRC